MTQLPLEFVTTLAELVPRERFRLTASNLRGTFLRRCDFGCVVLLDNGQQVLLPPTMTCILV